MQTQNATVTRIINAPVEIIDQLLADNRNGHPRILPKDYFLSPD